MKKKSNNISILSEVSAVASVYFAMIYVLIIIPNVLSGIGIPYNAAFLAVCLASAFGCFMCAAFAQKPFVFAPYIGENSFLAFSAVMIMGYSYREALGCAFWAAVIILLISLTDIKKYLIDNIPNCIRSALPVAIGLFLTILGLLEMGVVQISSRSLMLKLGSLNTLSVMMGMLCLLIIIILRALNVRLNVLFGIAITLLIAAFKGLISIPAFTMPEFSNIFLNLNIKGTLGLNYLTLIITFFVFLLNDMTAVSVSALSRTKQKDATDYQGTMLATAISSCMAPILGCVSSGVYPESILAVECGAKTKFVPITLGIMFLLSIFLIPFLSVIPNYICAAVLVYIGILLTSEIEHKGFSADEFSDYVPAFLMVVLTCFTVNLAVGICVAFIVYLALKLCTGKLADINLVSIIFGVLSVVFFMFYPY